MEVIKWKLVHQGEKHQTFNQIRAFLNTSVGKQCNLLQQTGKSWDRFQVFYDDTLSFTGQQYVLTDSWDLYLVVKIQFPSLKTWSIRYKGLGNQNSKGYCLGPEIWTHTLNSSLYLGIQLSFSCSNVQVSGLMLWSLIHLELIFFRLKTYFFYTWIFCFLQTSW